MLPMGWRTERQTWRWAAVVRGTTLPVLGGGLGLAAWGIAAHPALAILMPLIWVLAPSRASAAAVSAAYALAVVRFLPDMAGTWFGSAAVGIAIWLGIGAVAAFLGAICWPRSSSALPVAAGTLLFLAGALISPLAAVLPGHPIIGWGYLLRGWGWTGVGLMFVATAGLAVLVRVVVPTHWPGRRWPIAAGLAALGVVLVGAAEPGDPGGGRLAGRVGAVNTAWGGFPAPGSMEVVERIGRIGSATRQLSGGEDGFDTVVYPEAVLGLYDPSLSSVVNLEITRVLRQTGQTVVVGADLMIGRGLAQNIALVFRPDGSSSWVAARQTTPVAQWAPWNGKLHFPADWLSPSTVTLSAGIRARVMFCHEEFMPVLHLISEAREEHQLVIALANLWAAESPLANAIQASHTEGMANLFRRRFVRAVNGAK